MRHVLVIIGLLATAAITTSSARAQTPSLHEGIAITISDTRLVYAKFKGWKGKAMKRRGPPRWAPAHGLRRKRGW